MTGLRSVNHKFASDIIMHVQCHHMSSKSVPQIFNPLLHERESSLSPLQGISGLTTGVVEREHSTDLLNDVD